ncbi:MAG: molybdopterin cofactor-binding domain-containing protein, partial [Alphaproteobacteria bacterium]
MSHGFGAALKFDDGKPRLPGSLHLNRRLSQWLHFRADGVVEVKPGKVELGQGILTALAQIAADELDVAPERIRIISVVTPDSPDEAVTSGSLSVQDSGSAIRHASADARRIFLSVAAQRSGVAFEAITVTDGDFIGPQGKIGSYWQFADAGLLEVEASPEARAKPMDARRLVGVSA